MKAMKRYWEWEKKARKHEYRRQRELFEDQ